MTKSTIQPFTKDAALTVAKILLDIKAVNLRPDEPYTLTSGWASPTYIDCRKIISFVNERRTIIDLMAELVDEKIGRKNIQAVAGGETAGIPYGAWLADALDLPMLYVRKKPKGFGRKSQIEGEFKEGDTILLAEDMATDGGSKVAFVNALRHAGAKVTDCTVVFYYGAFPSSGALESLNVNMHYLASWQDILEVAERDGYFNPQIIEKVREFLKNPVAWSEAHGGANLQTAKLASSS